MKTASGYIERYVLYGTFSSSIGLVSSAGSPLGEVTGKVSLGVKGEPPISTWLPGVAFSVSVDSPYLSVGMGELRCRTPPTEAA